ncbi:MAG: FKBP-type peptidyl-prolyl cis-trans isomerase [Deltaproteobacteria bacterium]
MSKGIETGDTVTFNYEGKIEDGSTFRTFDEEPFAVEIGSGSLVKGLEEGLLGMEADQEKEFTVSPENGYGVENPELVHTVEAKLFDDTDITPEAGMILKTPHGNCHVVQVQDDKIKISYNHPLAGHTLHYKVKIINIEKNKSGS